MFFAIMIICIDLMETEAKAWNDTVTYTTSWI